MAEKKELVAHYTSLSVACEHILPSGRIRLSPFGRTNDPREYLRRLASIQYSESAPPDEGAIRDAYNKTMLQNCRVFCATTDATNNPHDVKSKLCYGRPRMWALYGDNHRGVCMVFDRKLLTNEVRSAFSTCFEGAVSYSDDAVTWRSHRIDLDEFDADDLLSSMHSHVSRYANDLFFVKGTDWQTEDEFRCIVYDASSSGYCHVEYRKALKAIYLGVDYQTVYTNLLRELASKHMSEVELYRLQWHLDANDFVPVRVN